MPLQGGNSAAPFSNGHFYQKLNSLLGLRPAGQIYDCVDGFRFLKPSVSGPTAPSFKGLRPFHFGPTAQFFTTIKPWAEGPKSLLQGVRGPFLPWAVGPSRGPLALGKGSCRGPSALGAGPSRVTITHTIALGYGPSRGPLCPGAGASTGLYCPGEWPL